ncbi:hypothetical protein C8Q76DRAFT_636815 [Earliella scabrosa]|nr:hypothetical protein C8Q76DRAFT_636815 [Earliella scabrosa]
MADPGGEIPEGHPAPVIELLEENPYDAQRPDFAGQAYQYIREHMTRTFMAADNAAAVTALEEAWNIDIQQKKTTWDQQAGERARRAEQREPPPPEQPPQLPGPPQQQPPADDPVGEPEPEGEKAASKSKLPPIIEGVPPETDLGLIPAPFALQKLRDKKYVELFYFTREACEAAAELQISCNEDALAVSRSDTAIVLSNAIQPMKNVRRDELLEWDQMTAAGLSMARWAGEYNWGQHAKILWKFFMVLMSHPARDEKLGEKVLTLYQAQYRRHWHREMELNRAFDLSVVNNDALQRIKRQYMESQMATTIAQVSPVVC